MSAVRQVILRPFARIDGLPVAIGIVGDLQGMQAWFLEQTGYHLRVRSGIRTYAEQERIFRQRYTLTPNGRRVYDIRTWQGRVWYRIDPTGTVAAPGTSNHETGRSVDLYDTGPDAGVGSSFTAPRSRLLSANAHRWGFTHTGKNFAEPWHYEQLQIADPWLGRGKPLSIDSSDPGQLAAGEAPAPAPKTTPAPRRDTMSIIVRREKTKAAFVVQPGRFIKHVPNSEEETLVKYAEPGIGEFRDLSDGDLGKLLYSWGFPELGGKVDNLPLAGSGRSPMGYYWSPGPSGKKTYS